jgi:ubiquitin C-terminal hydrolase
MCGHQLNKSSAALPNKIIININMPKMIVQYNKGIGTIHLHNRVHVDEVRFEHNLLTKDWARRLKFSIFGMICIDTSLFYQHIVHEHSRMRSNCKFFGRHLKELINNKQ